MKIPYGIVTLILTAVLSSQSVVAQVGLGQWTVNGTQKLEPASDGSFSLPADTQLYRRVTGNGVTLTILSAPVFPDDPTEVPILELGSNALAFVKQGDVGVVKLIQRDQDAVDLPLLVTLDSEGKAIEPLSLELTLKAGSLIVSAQGMALPYAVKPQSGPADIILSTGATHSWSIQRLAISTGPVAETVDAGRSESSKAPSGRPDSVGSIDRDRDLLEDSPDADVLDIKKTAVKDTARDTSNRTITLEVFTPPSVRRGRTAEVRAKLHQANRE